MGIGEMASGAAAQRAPEPAHDPIAIAALIAELPELEAKFLAAMKTAEEANKALDVIQDRLDQAMNVLRSKAPRGSKWNSGPKREISQQDLQQLYAHVQNMNAQNAGGMMGQNAAQNAHLAQQISSYEQKVMRAVAAPPPPKSIFDKGDQW
jgi:hypothetical protein